MTTREIDAEMLVRMIDALDFPIYTFDKNRKILCANRSTNDWQRHAAGQPIGAADTTHLDHNHYYDEEGNRLPFPRGSVIERALQGEETHDLILEHRNVQERTHQWISISCVPVMKDGEFQYGILWYRDVSRKKSREDKLQFLLEAMKVLTLTSDLRQRLEEKAALVVPALADWCAIEVADRDGKLERMALVHRDPRQIERIKEYEAKYPVAETTAERVVRTGQIEFIPRVTEQMIDEAEDMTAEQREEVRNLHLSSIIIFPIGEPGEVLGALSLAYAESGRTYNEDDVEFFTEFANHLNTLLQNARLEDELDERDLFKDLFLASLSHELRNPLAPIKTSLELLRLKTNDPATEAELSVIEHQFNHMARLLDDLLDATRFVQGKIKMDKKPVDVAAIVDSARAALEPVAESKSIDFSVRGSGSILVCADRTRLEQALTNLVSNAVKFTPSGGKVSVQYGIENDQAFISVEDTGAGITSDEREHLFEPYYQSERVRAGNSGLGIGLRLVYEIMHLHEGTVEVTSDGPGLGSRFIMRLPSFATTTYEVDDAPAQLASGPTRRILIIDDNQAAADALVRLFTALGYTATARYSAKEAFIHMDDTPVDIIFADIGMPEMNGYDFVRTLRENGYTDLPAVALTGYGLEEDRTKALEAGFNEHLTKPVGAEDLKRVIVALT